MKIYIVVQLQPVAGEPCWTIADAATGHANPDAARFISKQKAEEMAEIMNGKLSGGIEPP